MKRMMDKRALLSTVTALMALLLIGASAWAGQLDVVQKAIRDNGKHWVAGETENSRTPAYSPEYAKGRRIGLIKPTLTGKETLFSATSSSTVSSAASLPTAFDWSTGGSLNDGRNYVTPVHNQGSCGSCWAFATTAALESYTLIQGGDSTCYVGSCDLAEQMVLTCSGGGSCSGGSITTPSNYFVSTGVATEAADPYEITSTVCNPASYWATQAHKIKSWVYVATSSPTVGAIKSALVVTGPLVTTMAVYQDFYLYYKSGVYSYTFGSYVGSHAILIVGYQDDAAYPGGGYFRVKNSWGTSWGEAGFFRIAYSELNTVVNFGDYTLAYQSASSSSIPTAPTSLTGNALSSSQISLSWADNALNEDGFKIERCAGSSCSAFTQIASVGANVTTYTNSSLSASTTYTYRVRAFNISGDSGYSNTASVTTLAPPPAPTAPSALTATGGKLQVALSWADTASTEDGFVIERCTGSGCVNFAQIATVTANIKAYTNKSLKRATTYTYRVRAYNVGGYSGYSNTAVAKTN